MSLLRRTSATVLEHRKNTALPSSRAASQGRLLVKALVLAATVVVAIAVPSSASSSKGDPFAKASLAERRASSRWCMRRVKCKARVVFRHRRQLLRDVAPYVGPNGTRWAIPWHIVSCESKGPTAPLGGDWTVSNSELSGAHGPYQLLGHGEPWPVRSFRDRLAHHRIAAALWKGGRGSGNWAQCL